ncbi:uncharacterized protein LOC118163810 [Oxyura jamaicensis]|uniref:uncharacterized protein LOC118163810 n=1 Tax=Oxyura jamaicensis TaxID=8884 RepID=UPI0015A66A12|nr:uncharacterized protein LOC118163810 [Oxyura jamaicensis]
MARLIAGHRIPAFPEDGGRVLLSPLLCAQYHCNKISQAHQISRNPFSRFPIPIKIAAVVHLSGATLALKNTRQTSYASDAKHAPRSCGLSNSALSQRVTANLQLQLNSRHPKQRGPAFQPTNNFYQLPDADTRHREAPKPKAWIPNIPELWRSSNQSTHLQREGESCNVIPVLCNREGMQLLLRNQKESSCSHKDCEIKKADEALVERDL